MRLRTNLLLAMVLALISSASFSNYQALFQAISDDDTDKMRKLIEDNGIDIDGPDAFAD